MEAVLSGVSAGVIGLDSQDRITLVSRSAEQAAGPSTRPSSSARSSRTRCPMFARRARQARRARAEAARAARGHAHVGGEERTFAVRVTREQRRAAATSARSSPSTTSPSSSSAQRTVGLGRRRPPHRPRDQEPADADTTFGRAHPPQVRQERSPRTARRSTSCTDDHRAPGRRHQDAWSTSSPPSRASPKPRDGARTTCATSVQEPVVLFRERPRRHRLRASSCRQGADHRRPATGA